MGIIDAPAALARSGPPAKAIRGAGTYANAFWHIGTGAQAGFISGYTIAFPARYANAFSLDRVAIEVTGAAAGSACRLALYADGGAFKPVTLVQEFTAASQIDSTTTGIKELTVSQAFTPGALYWWALKAENATVTVRAVDAGWPPFPTSQAEALNPVGRYGHEWSPGNGAFAPTWAGTAFGGGRPPAIAMRVV